MAGIPRKIDDHRRFIIPNDVCEQLDIIPGKDLLTLSVDGDSIILKKSHNTSCVLCKTNNAKFITYKGLKVCTECAQQIAKSLD